MVDVHPNIYKLLVEDEIQFSEAILRGYMLINQKFH